MILKYEVKIDLIMSEPDYVKYLFSMNVFHNQTF